MSRWLSIFLLLSALFGFGAALQVPAAPTGNAVMVSAVIADDQGHASTADLLSSMSDDGSAPDTSRPLLQGEADTVVDVTALFEPARQAGTLVTVAATPSRFGWTPVATPFIEGLQRPPRQALVRA